MEDTVRNSLRSMVTRSRKNLEESISELLQGQYGIESSGKIAESERMGHLSEDEKVFRAELISRLDHIKAYGLSAKDATSQLIREIAFTHLNRLCAYKMLEKRGHIRESVSRGLDSNGFLRFLADHDEEERLYREGKQFISYQHYLTELGRSLNEEIGVLFSPLDATNRLYPPQRIMESVLADINDPQFNDIWELDETIGWIYQYFTPKELRDKAREESQSPRNSYELAFLNQFYTPRYVVEFLTDNTLGRIWYEMCQGKTALTDVCSYMVRHPDEVFLGIDSIKETFGDELVLNDQRFVLEDINEIPEFSIPICELIQKEGQMSYYSDDAAGMRLHSFAHLVRPYDWAHDPRHEQMVTLLQDAGTGLHNDPLPGKTQDLWDTMYAIVRNNRFCEGIFEENATSLTRIANEIRRRIFASRDPEADKEVLLNAPYLVKSRTKKDPRDLHILDPACGSGHFLLYCFDLLELIYQEAWNDPSQGIFSETEKTLKEEYPDETIFRRSIPELILRYNLHGVDIDKRATQIASLALWMRAQRSYAELGMKRGERPAIRRSHIVCAEPMPGERPLLEGFLRDLKPPVLQGLVRAIFTKMELAGEAGSLLKIEEEIQSAIAEAYHQWQTKPEDTQTTLFPSEQKTTWQVKLYNVQGISDETFWDLAEQKVLEALKAYAKKADEESVFQQRLFAEDAERGLAFIEVAKKRYDVVLMNPPFGSSTERLKEWFRLSYPDAAENVSIGFINRSMNYLNNGGYIGIINDTPWIQKSSYNNFRLKIKSLKNLFLCVELGWGELGTNVEVAAAIFSKDRNNKTFFKNISNKENKNKLLCDSCKLLDFHIFDLNAFSFIEGSPFSYEISPTILNFFIRDLKLSYNDFIAYGGVAASDSTRVFRCWWEINPMKIGYTNKWAFCQNGSPYSPYYYPTYFLILVEFGSYNTILSYNTARIPNKEMYGKNGYSFGKRTLEMYAYPFPPDQVITWEGQGIFPLKTEKYWHYLAIVNSHLFSFLSNIVAGQHKTAGYLNNICLDISKIQDLSEVSKQIYNNVYTIDTLNENSHAFLKNYEMKNLLFNKDFSPLITKILNIEKEIDIKKSHINSEIEKITKIAPIIENAYINNTSYTKTLLGQNLDEQLLSKIHLSLMMGIIFGRWDILSAINSKVILNNYDNEPFISLSSCTSAMLTEDNGMPLLQNPKNYPLNIDADGIIVDDDRHNDDIISRIREVIQIIWEKDSEEFEKYLCECLKVKNLRIYFGKAGKGGFWDDHLRRYSKSRRKAPIYWLLQSDKKNYAVWIYYHRYDHDTLFKVLERYVKPKINGIERHIDELTAKKTSLPLTDSSYKKILAEIEEQEDLLAEINRFADKIQTVADLSLVPDLDDGVVLTAAPLWEVIPWKDLADYWKELLEGKYDWSSIGKQLREKALVKG